MNLQERAEQVRFRIAEACRRSGRDRDSVEIIAVTKYVSLDTARAVVDLGFDKIGENRWQDVKPKWEALGSRVEWHFIGHLQTNKVKDVVGKFRYIHSLDRLSLAKEINKRGEAMDTVVDCLIQVNISGEESKYGLSPEQFFPFIEQVRSFPFIRVAGLMTMAPYESEPEDTRPVFRGLRQLRDECNQRALLKEEIRHLSMGMSNDFEVAIEEGATWVRLGSILVGKE
ncbi:MULTISPECIES: YggS family pyridoxal phosphate-dependent enzyme [Paenibacillus]|jgi:pyridoxal phosphate enzyme (YggS family)|uniref:Pyridoxal phosphate homeostasis protein n=1 Tax=Paenibacillus residui TaxID=629724 RepID=A0ABW3DES5_9BACL|nr:MULTISPECIES: YggS family pyridoxal phosphate-dependent enzyme [Paenibacillaceae]